jgi:hypothetical protein
MPKGKSNPKLARNVQSMLKRSGLPTSSKVVISPAKSNKGKGK